MHSFVYWCAICRNVVGNRWIITAEPCGCCRRPADGVAFTAIRKYRPLGTISELRFSVTFDG